MASVDTPEDTQRFAAEHGGSFAILSDPTKESAMAYGTIRTDRPPAQQFAARFTYYIGPDGKILAIDKGPRGTGVAAQTAGQDVITKLDELGVKKK